MNEKLWRALQDFDFDDPEAGFSFSKRLARETGWTQGYTGRVINEYRRFLYLCCEAGHPVTPSDEVDQAWHLHLCYTRSYWQDLCRDTLGQEVHHGPTKGGAEERGKFRDWYERTLNAYRSAFGEEPPADVWPEADIRFRAARFERVDRSRNWVVSKPTLAMVLVVLLFGFFAVSCNSEETLVVSIVIGVFLVVVIGIIAASKRGGGGGGNSGGCGGGFFGGCSDDGGSGCGGGGGCGGGCGGS